MIGDKLNAPGAHALPAPRTMPIIPYGGDQVAALAAAILNVERGTHRYDPGRSAAEGVLVEHPEPHAPMTITVDGLELRVRPREGEIVMYPLSVMGSRWPAIHRELCGRFLDRETEHLAKTAMYGNGHHYSIRGAPASSSRVFITAAAEPAGLSQDGAAFTWNVKGGDREPDLQQTVEGYVSAEMRVSCCLSPELQLAPKPGGQVEIANRMPKMGGIVMAIMQDIGGGEAILSTFKAQYVGVEADMLPRDAFTDWMSVQDALEISAGDKCSMCKQRLAGWGGVVGAARLCFACASMAVCVAGSDRSPLEGTLWVAGSEPFFRRVTRGGELFWSNGECLVMPPASVEHYRSGPLASDWWWKHADLVCAHKRIVATTILGVAEVPPPGAAK